MANTIEFDDSAAGGGAYAGFDESEPTSRSGGKPAVMAMLKEGFKGGRAHDVIVMVGDGNTDLEVRAIASRRVASRRVASRRVASRGVGRGGRGGRGSFGERSWVVWVTDARDGHGPALADPDPAALGDERRETRDERRETRDERDARRTPRS